MPQWSERDFIDPREGGFYQGIFNNPYGSLDQFGRAMNPSGNWYIGDQYAPAENVVRRPADYVPGQSLFDPSGRYAYGSGYADNYPYRASSQHFSAGYPSGDAWAQIRPSVDWEGQNLYRGYPTQMDFSYLNFGPDLGMGDF